MKKIFLALAIIAAISTCKSSGGKDVRILNPDPEIERDSMIKVSTIAQYGDTIQLKKIGSNPWEVEENATRFVDTIYITHSLKEEAGKINTVVVIKKIGIVE